MTFIKTFLFVLLICTSTNAQERPQPATADLTRLAAWMSGSFSSEAQAKADTTYFDVRLHIMPIWKTRTDSIWFYVEQALGRSTDKPYRQRVYRLTQLDAATFESAVYTFSNPTPFVGAWKLSEPLAGFSPDSLVLRKGCSVVLKKQAESFAGGTVEKNCSSDLRGASYATSSVTVKANELLSWDRGFDASGKQVWGATQGGYVFKKTSD